MSPAHAVGLTGLQARLAHDLACLQLPAPRWTPPLTHQGLPVADVAIVGAGMAGLALAAALQFKGVAAVLYDQAAAGFEGPWATTARMETLRSPKQLAGPALGQAALTFRAWFEAQWGEPAWEAMDKIPRLQWMDYLRWYRQVLALEVRNGHHVSDVWPRTDLPPTGSALAPQRGLVELRVLAGGQARTAWARRVVIATGRAGLGGPLVPALADGLSRQHWAHSDDEFDYRQLKGLRVGVIGAGASAMDSAATALEAGAAQLHLLVRRPDIPRINKGKGAGNPGFIHGFAKLPDAWKWRFRRYIHVQQVPPPRGSTLRVSAHGHAHFHLDCAVLAITEHAAPLGSPGPGADGADGADAAAPKDAGGQARRTELRLHTSQGDIALDFIVFATGFKIDWALRPLLRHIAPHVRTWQDRFTPQPDDEDAELSACPDLGPHFEFQPRPGAHCPGLERVHCFCYPAALSLGVITGDIPAISEGAQQLAIDLAGLLHAEDIAHHFGRMQAFAEPEVFGDEWVASPLPCNAGGA